MQPPGFYKRESKTAARERRKIGWNSAFPATAALDASRVVMADTDDGAADCDFPACIHAPVCKIAAELREFLGEMVEEPAEQTGEK